MQDGFTAEPAAMGNGYLKGYFVRQYMNGVIVVSQFIDAESRDELESYFPGDRIDACIINDSFSMDA